MDAVLLRIDDVSLLRRQELSRQRGTAGLEQLLEVLVQVENLQQIHLNCEFLIIFQQQLISPGQEGHIYTTCDQDHFMATRGE